MNCWFARSIGPRCGRRLLLFAAGLCLPAIAGCIVVSATRVERPQPVVAEPRIERASSLRYTPYGAALDRVLRQEAEIASELRKRDWAELEDELCDWQSDARRLAGMARTASDPDLMLACCEDLQNHIRRMREAQRRRDADGVARALDDAGDVLMTLSTRFPLVEPLGTASDETPAE